MTARDPGGHGAPRGADVLAGRVAGWAASRPDAEAFTELRFRLRERVPVTLTYAGLHAAAGALAERLRGQSAPGDRVAILCAHGIDYAIAFLACLYSNRVAVPLFPATGARHRERLHAVLADARPALTLLSAHDEASAPTLGNALGRVLTLPPDPTAAPAQSPAPVVDTISSDLAYLQYTSGSTKSPAGVRVTHANLATALAQLRTALSSAVRRPIVTWLPFFHDMGLILGLSLPLSLGVHAVALAPAEFVKRPIHWLRALDDYRAGITGCPSFGLALAVSHTTAEERAGLDLSGLDILVNGSEPVRADVLERFTETYARHGFRHRAHTPGFGLAEATLAVTLCDQRDEPVWHRFDRAALAEGRAVPLPDSVASRAQDGVCLVGCGAPVGQDVRVVDPVRRSVQPPGHVGEIWVAGGNVCDGYFGRPDATEEVFGAVAACDARRWLRTGDLGFHYAGQLYLAGRRKDVIVVDGRNHYPADIETTVESCAPEIRPGHVTAFGHDDGCREDLVVVAELSAEAAAASTDLSVLARRIRTAVAATHEVMPGSVVLVEPGWIPKTTSGKLRRGECRTRYLAGRLRPVAMI